MTDSTQSTPHARETPLEKGLRRYAPKPGEGRRVAVSDFIVALLLVGRRPGSPPGA